MWNNFMILSMDRERENEKDNENENGKFWGWEELVELLNKEELDIIFLGLKILSL